MQGINDFIIAAAGQPWVLLMVLACCSIDGFFPPIPSESVVVGLAAVAGSSGSPNVWLLAVVAALGAFIGDNIAYTFGASIGTRRWPWMRSRRMQTAFNWAGKELQRRAASLIMVARFIPTGVSPSTSLPEPPVSTVAAS
jgi:membrane protein DedA with SNARE-associated domain